MGIRSLVSPDQARPIWTNHIIRHSCLVDSSRGGGQITMMRGFWFTPGTGICDDYYAPPIVCSKVAHAFASTVVYPNPYVRDSAGETTYSHARDQRRRMNFKTQTLENPVVQERDGTTDVYEFIDRVGQQISLLRREVVSTRHATSESTIALMQMAWNNASEYTNPLRELLVDCRPIDHDQEHFARLRICTFGAEPVGEHELANDLFCTVRLDLDLLVFHG